MIESTEEFVRLRNSDIPSEYNRSANEEAPISVWLDLINEYPEMRVWVARNRTIPKKIVDMLSKDPDPFVRDAICSKYPLDIELYVLFSKDMDEGVRSRLTYNKNIPLSVLKDMSENDPSEFVKSQAFNQYNKRLIYK
ncbi:hypothetical protein [Enterobacter asburiae]|uniref:hypothetical protein n=1 Tax=Enterobacter asburiae TaxID=61645 RepID=UPI0021D0791D|nr:hypothetical protein [Enterobacter asburiae]MCU6243899.1 hypothetical protein [Enterobacter asburiae]